MTDTHASRTAIRFRRLGSYLLAIAVFTPVAALAQTLPAGWAVSDVGAPVIPGYAAHENETYTVSGAGRGIGASADQFTFAYRMLTGDGTVIARVAAINNRTPNAQVGVMMRESLDYRSKYVALLLGNTNELMFKRRTRTGGTTTNSKLGPHTAPVWVKLERQAGTITASWSSDGSTWTVIGSTSVAMTGTAFVGLAVTSYTDVAAAQASFTNVQVTSLADTGSPLPEGWNSQDIGGPGLPGKATYNAGTFALTGGGTDMAGTWDEFHYAYMSVDGDVDIVTRLRAVSSEWSKAGIMVRDTLTPNGAHASMFYANARGTAFQRRPTPGGSMVTTSWTSGSAPVWLKLSIRSGVVSGYRSPDGVTWTLAGTQTLTLPSPFYVGLAVSSRDNTTTVTTNIDNVRVQAVVQAINEPPAVALTAPVDGATFTAPATITVAADASDADGTIARVDFYQGSVQIGSVATSPYTVTWSNVPAGTYSLTAVATDNNGDTTTSAARTVTVGAPPNQPPNVSLTSPVNGATFSAPATITVSASATDTDGTVARVDFYQGATLIGSDATSPYSVSWSNVGPGAYSLTARATDNDGATATSPARSVTVTAATNQAPSVSLTAPADGATFAAPAAVTLSASATDGDGTIARVDFYQGSTLIASDTTSPYGVTWNNVPAGTYLLTARATDNAGAATTSAARSVTVTDGLPSEWTAVDIGSPAIAGSTSYSNGTYTVRAGGTDIWGTADQFHYVYRQVSGDFDVVARVASVQEAHSWSKAGVMIRETLAADAANAAMFVAASEPMAFQRRPVTGATTVTTNTPGQAPTFVKLARRGTSITASFSADGTAWTVVRTDTMTLPASFFVGLAVSSVNPTTATVAVFDSVTVTTVVNQPPTVSLIAPGDGATFPGPATMTVSADAADAEGAVARVDFYHGSALIGSDTSSPYSVTWSDVQPGSYSLTARATDSSGLTTTSSPRSITVTASTTQRNAVFAASPDHATLVTSYVLEIFASGANPATATPLTTQNLGKPAVVDGDCTVDVTATINGLAPGTYQATVSAVGSGGSSRSAPATFTR